MEQILVSQVANALFPEARCKLWVKVLGGWAAELLRGYYGGLWVGGTVRIEADLVRFEPNRVNRLVHVGPVSFEIPLTEIVSVQVEPAFVTNIVAITTARGSQRIRCAEAEKIAALIEDARPRRAGR